MSFGVASVARLSEFARIRDGQIADFEEARFDKPVVYAGGYQYAGVALAGSLTSDAVWSVIRVSYDANGRKIREQFRTDVVWDNRTIGW